MTFELVRIGWPNTAAILALVLLPMVATAAGLGRPHGPAAVLSQLEPATSCPGTGQDLALLASAESMLASAEPTATLR
jgi:hypothetical protein